MQIIGLANQQQVCSPPSCVVALHLAAVSMAVIHGAENGGGLLFLNTIVVNYFHRSIILTAYVEPRRVSQSGTRYHSVVQFICSAKLYSDGLVL